MSLLTSLGIVILATLTHGFLQLTPSIFTIFYHYASGKKSTKKADSLGLYFILGSETFITVVFLAIYLFICLIFSQTPYHGFVFLPWIMAGIFIALGLFTLFFYFRNSRGTELFISRRFAIKLIEQAKSVKTRSDAFTLGALVGIVELFLTLPIFLIVSIATMNITSFPRSIIIFIYIIISALPLYIYLMTFHNGYNLATIQRIRTRNKSFYRIIICLGYTLLALATINMGLVF